MLDFCGRGRPRAKLQSQWAPGSTRDVTNQNAWSMSPTEMLILWKMWMDIVWYSPFMSFPDHVNPLHGALKFPGFRAGVLGGRDDQVTKIDHTTILFGFCQLQRWIAHFIPFPEIRMQVIEDNGAVTKKNTQNWTTRGGRQHWKGKRKQMHGSRQTIS